MQEQFTDAAVKAVSSRIGGFLLDCPPRANHPRNLPFSWADGKLLFGWDPVATLELSEATCGRDPLGSVEDFLAPLETGAAIAVAFLSYDLGGLIEPKAASRHPADALPLAFFGLYERFWEFDPATGSLLVCEGRAKRPATDDDMRQIADSARSVATPRDAQAARDIHADFTPEAYVEAVAAGREYILSGDIFEVNLSQRFTAQCSVPTWDLYRRLRRLSPAPYAAFLTRPSGAILSSSPELFLRVEGDRVLTRPIKGTAARSDDPREDKLAARRLVASEKDNAELAMIIDLERNDLGRVCRYGSVVVRERARLETFSRVHHLVSTVEGRLESGAGLRDLLAATFPGGSITGAPKVRAMQIIDELEPLRRGLYTGSIGYVLPGGRAEFNIAIRTMIMHEGVVALQVGGAVTADSDPQAEYDETLAKALGMLAALGLEARFAPERQPI